MTWPRAEAVGLLEYWHRASTTLSLMLLGKGVSLTAPARVRGITPLAVEVSLADGEGALTVTLGEVAAFEHPSSTQCTAIIIFRMISGDSIGLFETLPEQDFSFDDIPAS